MSGSLIGVLISSAVALAGSGMVYRVNRRTSSTDASQRQIDQIQEDREADRAQFEKAAGRFQKELESLQEQLKRAFERIEAGEAMLRVANDYALQLRYHISEGKEPPPPPFPAEMTRGMPGDR